MIGRTLKRPTVTTNNDALHRVVVDTPQKADEIKALLEAKGHKPYDTGLTPFQLLARQNAIPALEAFIEYFRANDMLATELDYVDGVAGRNALFCAIESGQTAMALALLEVGAVPQAIFSGPTPMDKLIERLESKESEHVNNLDANEFLLRTMVGKLASELALPNGLEEMLAVVKEWVEKNRSQWQRATLDKFYAQTNEASLTAPPSRVRPVASPLTYRERLADMHAAYARSRRAVRVVTAQDVAEQFHQGSPAILLSSRKRGVPVEVPLMTVSAPKEPAVNNENLTRHKVDDDGFLIPLPPKQKIKRS